MATDWAQRATARLAAVALLASVLMAVAPQAANAATGDLSVTTTNLGLAGDVDPGSNSDWGFPFTVGEADQGAAGTDLNGDGDTTDDIVHVWTAATGMTTNLGLAGDLPGGQNSAGWGFAFAVTEGGQGAGGTDLNGDGDKTDDVVHVWTAATGMTTNLGLAFPPGFSQFVEAADWGSAFTVSETTQGAGGTDLNGDGDRTDNVIHVWSAATGMTSNLALASGATASAADWGFNFSVPEADQGAGGGTDLNGDGDKTDKVLHVWIEGPGGIANMSLASSGGPSASWGFNFAIFEPEQGAGGTDLNGDGDKTDNVMHVWKAPTGLTPMMTSNLALVSSGGGSASWGFRFSVSEPGGTDLNGDGDTSDLVVHDWTAATGLSTNLGLAGGFGGTAAPWGFGFTVFESEQGGIDLNGDGDTGDVVIHARDIASAMTTNLGLAGFPGTDGPWGLSFAVDESSQGAAGTDFNGDGDKSDFVVQVREATTAAVTNTGLAVSRFGTGGTFGFSFSVEEADQGVGGTDLNGDGDTTDSVVHVALASERVPTTVGLVDPVLGRWLLFDAAGESTASFLYGNPIDVPVPGDWDGDGDTTPGLYRQSDGFFYARNSNTQGIADDSCFAGDPADIPLSGDWDGDGDDNLGLYRPSEQKFYLFTITCTGSPMGTAPISFLFGNPGDKPVSGDWDGDGIDEVGLHRESTGFFYWRNTLDTGIASGEMFFGDPGDRFVAGDWGIIDNIDTPAVYRGLDSMGLPATTWYFRHTLTQGIADLSWVVVGPNSRSLPIAGKFGLG